MSLNKACAACGDLISADAGEDAICDNCAAALEREGGVPTVVVSSEPRSASGTPSSIRGGPAPVLETVGDFEVLSKLGQGGMGAVYRARQISLDRPVALKILPSQFEEDASYLARFQREATVAASINHPNLVRVYSFGEADGCHYIAMELVEGENLRQYLKRHGALPAQEALRICLGVARGLQCGWQKAQLIHRDVKPSNIYLSEAGEVKLGDLGLAKSLLSNTTGVTNTGTAIGTPHYISPEQARGDKDLDLRADIYSLGCTLYELLTGMTPYQGTDAMAVMGMHLHSPPPAIMKVMPECPLALGRVVNKMVRKIRRERHESYEELIQAMEAAVEQIENPVEKGVSPLVEAWKEIGAAEREFRMARGPALTGAERSGAADANPTGGFFRSGIGKASVAAAALAAAVGVYFAMRPSPAPLVRNGGAKVAVASPAPVGVSSSAPASTPVPATAPASLPASGNLITDPGSLTLFGGATFDRGTLLVPPPAGGVIVNTSRRSRDHQHDGVIALSANFKLGVHDVPFVIMRQSSGNARYQAAITVKGDELTLSRITPENQGVVVKAFSIVPFLNDGEDYRLEVHVVGAHFTVVVNGRVVGETDDANVTEGYFGVRAFSAEPARVKRLEFQSLDEASEPWRELVGNPQNFEGGAFVETGPGELKIRSRADLRITGTKSQRNAALRLRGIYHSDNLGVSLHIRDNPKGAYGLGIDGGDPSIRLNRLDRESGQTTCLAEYRPRTPLAEGAEYELELTANGDILTSKLNGELLGSVRDSLVTEGYFGLTPHGRDKDGDRQLVLSSLKLLDLDHSGAPGGALDAKAQPTNEPWQDLMQDPGGQLGLLDGASLASNGVLLPRGGQVRFRSLASDSQRDGAVRARFAYGSWKAQIVARADTNGMYNLRADDDHTVALTMWNGGTHQSYVLIRSILTAPLPPDQDFVLELRAEGSILTAKLNDSVIGTAKDDAFERGRFFVGVFERVESPSLLKGLKWLDLDAHPSADHSR